jgi:hypothetical protein
MFGLWSESYGLGVCNLARRRSKLAPCRVGSRPEARYEQQQIGREQGRDAASPAGRQKRPEGNARGVRG